MICESCQQEVEDHTLPLCAACFSRTMQTVMDQCEDLPRRRFPRLYKFYRLTIRSGDFRMKHWWDCFVAIFFQWTHVYGE